MGVIRKKKGKYIKKTENIAEMKSYVYNKREK